jgi:hypothetical protein
MTGTDVILELLREYMKDVCEYRELSNQCKYRDFNNCDSKWLLSYSKILSTKQPEMLEMRR